jgi:sugar fermentation stimulation protein A
MRFPHTLFQAQLLRRYKRFLADIIWPDGRQETVHCPNPGSMIGLNEPGMTVYISDSKNPKRKLRYTLELVQCGHDLVLVNTARPNSIVEEQLLMGTVKELAAFDELRREVPYGQERSRVDFVLKKGEKRTFLEVKGVTLAEANIGYFPDSVTRRGTKHLRELGRIARTGADSAVLIFLVCRADVKVVRPAANIDPDYARALRTAKRNGVQILAYKVAIDSDQVFATESVPVQVYSKDRGPRRS